MFKLNNTPIGLDTPFTTEDGTQYPANWLRLASPEERAAIGITEVDDPVAYDDRFYWGVNSPKQLEDEIVIPEEGQEFESYLQKGLKSQWSAQIKDTTNKLLAATDWMVIRKAERDVAIPADTVAYRAAVLVECDRLLAAIAGAADVEAFAIVVGAQNWPEVK
jgi:hypothetical protein